LSNPNLVNKPFKNAASLFEGAFRKGGRDLEKNGKSMVKSGFYFRGTD